jgi:hypothetical protein
MPASGFIRGRKAGVVAAAAICLLTVPALPSEAAVEPWCAAGVEFVEGLGRACEMPNGLYQLETDAGSNAFTHGPDPWVPALEPNGPGASELETASADDGPDTANAASDPECVTDTTAYQIVVTYAHPTGTDLYATRAATIRDLVKETNGLLDDEVGEAGGDAWYRVQCDGTTITVLNQPLSTATATTFSAVTDALDSSLDGDGIGGVYNNPKYKHWIWYEGTGGGASGTGHIYGDDDLELENFNNGHSSAISMMGVQWGGCCGGSFFGSRTWMHENGHNMGAVQGDPAGSATIDASPNSTTGYHCNDGIDIMCYADGSSNSAYVTTACGTEEFDCGNNDYFAPWPTGSNYLVTHHNVASCYNRFLTFSYCGQTLAWSTSATSLAEGSGTSSLTITRTGGTDGTNGVVVTSASVSATSGTDFTAISTTKTLTTGEASTTVSVTVAQDSDDESNETFTVTLSNATGGPLGLGTPTVITVTITDDDDPPPPAGALAFSTSATSRGEGSGTASVTISRTGGSAGTVGVTVTSAGVSATSGADFTAISETKSLGAGVLSTTLDVTILQDADDEPDETFTVTLSSPTGGATLGATTVITITITDDDATPVPGVLALSASSASIGEGAGTVTVTVNRTVGSDGAVGATLTTSPGTAAAGSDYTHRLDTVALANTVTSATFDVTILQDPDDESDETFTVTLSSPTGGASLGATTAIAITIDDDDATPVPGVLALSASSASIGESAGTVTVTVNRTVGTDGAVGATLATSPGTAAAGSDYTHVSGPVALANGVTSATFDVTLPTDAIDEPNETFTVTLSSPTGGASLGATTVITITITDDDATPTITFEIADGGAVDEADGSVDVVVNRTGATGATASASWALVSTPADNGDGPSEVNDGTVSFPIGDVAESLTISTGDDGIYTGDRTLTLTLSSPAGAALGAISEHAFTVTDDEPVPFTSFLGFETATADVAENAGVVTVTVERTGSTDGEISATVLRAGTADAGDATVVGEVVLADGITLASADVTITNDAVPEGEETIVLTLSSPVGAGLGLITEKVLTIDASDLQADGMIATTLDGAYRGDDVYSSDGTGQTLGGNSRRNVLVTRWVRIENDGPASAEFLMRRNTPQAGVAYKVFNGADDITAALATAVPVTLAPGDVVDLRVTLKFTRVFPNETRRSIIITTKRNSDGLLLDAVKAQIRYRA